MDKLKTIESLEDYQKAIEGHSIIVFSTTWCPDCHFLKTYIDDLVEENKDWTFYYVDRDKMVDLCIDLDIMGIPSFVAYHNGQEVGRYVDKLRKTQEQVQKFINEIQ